MWKFTVGVASPVGIPADLPSVHIALRDNSQVVILDPIPTSEFAFTIENGGSANKGLFLVAIPADLDVPTYLAERSKSEVLREDVIELGATADIPAHGSGAMVFNIALPTGRYLLLSVTPDRRQLLTQEYAEFAVA